MLNIFGGKITTYRRLAESALEHIGKHLDVAKDPWTAGAPLPGGDFAVYGVETLIAELKRAYPFLTDFWAKRLVRAYGTEAWDVMAGAEQEADMGRTFGASLTEREVRWLQKNEYARTAEDVVWRRNKLGLRLTESEIAALQTYMSDRMSERRARAAE